MDFLEFLVQKNIVSETTGQEIRALSKEGKHIEDLLVERGINNDQILTAKEEFYKVPAKKIGKAVDLEATLDFIPEKSADHYQILPLGTSGGVYEVGFVNPDDVRARDAIDFIASKNNLPYKVYVITHADFTRARGQYQELSTEVNDALTELEVELSGEKKVPEEGEVSTEEEVLKPKKPKEGAQIVEEAPVTKIVATILRYATEGGASDVHIEPLPEQVRVRFRIDGEMHTSLMLPKNIQSALAARIKILSNMKLDEKRKPQDGRFSAHIDGRKIDFRVSTFPTHYGEKVVMRILDSDRAILSLDKLGLDPRNLEMIRDGLRQPYGIVLISGPTGSGKTTTLYAMLNEVDKEKKNVLSLEDPVEYNVPGVSQSSVRPDIGYTFASGLRTTLRQDPDVIMVGEIRDKETAQLAIQAALTGHLVLSTIHTNSAVGVIPRLIDMGVDPYLIAPTLVLAIAQRLSKKLCPGAGKKLPIEGSIERIIGKEFQGLPDDVRSNIHIPSFVYSAVPSPGCPNGTRGRVAVFEILQMTKNIERIILDDPNEISIYNEARKNGMLTMKEDALLKAFNQIVPFEEINKL